MKQRRDPDIKSVQSLLVPTLGAKNCDGQPVEQPCHAHADAHQGAPKASPVLGSFTRPADACQCEDDVLWSVGRS